MGKKHKKKRFVKGHKKINKYAKYSKVCIFILFVVIVSLSFLSQQILATTVKLNQSIDLIQTCNNCTYCSLTINYPNMTRFIINNSMTKDGMVFNYSLNRSYTQTLGVYDWWYTCGNPQESATGKLTFEVTGNGKENPSGVIIVLFVLFFLIILGLLTYMFIYSLGHFINLDFDIIDMAYNLGLYFVVFGIYISSIYYLGNPQFEDFLLLLVQVGAITHIFIPFLAFMVSVIAGSMMKKKLNMGKPLTNPIGMRHFRGGNR